MSIRLLLTDVSYIQAYLKTLMEFQCNHAVFVKTVTDLAAAELGNSQITYIWCIYFHISKEMAKMNKRNSHETMAFLHRLYAYMAILFVNIFF